MKQILANYTVSISELKKNPTALLSEAEGETIAILNHNKPTAYLVPANVYEQLMELLDDHELREIAKERMNERSKAIKVSLDDL